MSTANVYDEQLLFGQIAAGDAEAFRQIFELYKKELFSTAIKLTKSQLAAEEITQEVFISLWVSREQLLKVENPGSYLFRMLFNKLSSYLKKESNLERIMKAAMQFNKSFVNATQEAVDANESQRRINEVVEKLPPQQKAVYTLSRLRGLKNDEIATELNISPNTVKIHLSKALQAIRVHLKDVAFVTAVLTTFWNKE